MSSQHDIAISFLMKQHASCRRALRSTVYSRVSFIVHGDGIIFIAMSLDRTAEFINYFCLRRTPATEKTDNVIKEGTPSTRETDRAELSKVVSKSTSN